MWRYIQPVEIIFSWGGIGRLSGIIKEKGWRKGILVCDPFFEKKARELADRSEGLIAGVFSNVTPNPRCREADECAALIKSSGADFAVAMGGGSAMDCAKAAAAAAVSGGSIVEYHSEGKKLTGSLPLIAVPTTAGTGSEVTNVSVLTDDVKGIKGPLGDAFMYPRVALIDPELTVSTPKQVTASCGLDVLAHALEGFWSVNHQPVCDAAALHAAGIVFEWLPAAYESGENAEARTKMSEASVVAGLAFGLPKTAASHACSYALTGLYHMPHGEACAFTLDAFCVMNAGAEGGRLNTFARKLGFDNAEHMAARIKEMKRSMGMKVTLKDAGIEEKDLPALAEHCMHPNLQNNPVVPGEKELIEMFKSMV